MKLYTTRDAANLLGLSPRQVREFARSGLLRAERGRRGEYLFSFQDLVLLRTAAGLHAARISPRRISQALDRLRAQLPQGRSLTELRIVAEDDRIVVHDGEAAWNPLSGQYHLDFTTADLGERVATIAPRAAAAVVAEIPGPDAGRWFEIGAELEPYAPDEARAAYERALTLDPRHADAHVNLGRLLHQAGDPDAAEAHYRAAIEIGPHATAAFDLAVLLEDLDRTDEAIRLYERALRWDPYLADAHYNLARVHESRGDLQAAVRHLAACKRIVDGKREGRKPELRSV